MTERDDVPCRDGTSPDARTFEWRNRFSGPVELVVDQRLGGSVKVTGTDSDEVSVTAVKRARGAAAANRTEKLFEQAEVAVKTDGNRVTVTCDADRPWLGWSSPPVRIDVSVSVPRGSAVDIDSGSGPVEVTGTRGPVKVDSGSGSTFVSGTTGRVTVDSGSGSVSIEESQGPVYVDVGSGSVVLRRVKGGAEIDGSSGSVTASEIEGDLTIDTGSGSIDVSRVIGDLNLDTGSGSVRLEVVKSRRIHADTGSGSITADFNVDPAGRYSLDTGSGRVTLVVPDDASFSLEAETGSGRIDCRLPLQVTRMSRHHLEGVLGEGEARITAETSSGGLVIRGRSGKNAGPRFRGPSAAAGRTAREHRDVVVRMVKEGKITAEQGEALLAALAGDRPETGRHIEVELHEPEEEFQDLEEARHEAEGAEREAEEDAEREAEEDAEREAEEAEEEARD